MDVLNKPITLKLNRNFMALRPETPERILVDMAKDTVRGVDIQYFQNPDGSYDFDNLIYVNPVKWEDWICLPIRDCDLYVMTPSRKIRIPTVVVCSEYNKVPMKRMRLTLENLAKRDGGRCCYTGEVLPRSRWSMEHLLPKSRGGGTHWKNVALCDKNVNQKKGNKTLEEAGLKLLINPKEPLPVPAVATISNAIHRDWSLFLLK